MRINAQCNKIDSLIKNINDNQLHGTCHYFWTIELKSPAADSLIKIGKEATNYLFPLLDKKEYGIITHYILSNIWVDTMNFNCLGYNKKDSSIKYNYCGLVFYEKNGNLFTEKDTLIVNKDRWAKKLNK